MAKSMIEQIDEMYDNHTFAEVEAWMLEQRDRIRDDPQGNVRDYIEVCNELASLYREQSRYAESIENFEEALAKTAELCHSSQTAEYAVILINVAGTYRYRNGPGDLDHALGNYQQALDIFTQLGMQGTYEYASVLNNMALGLLDKGGADERALALATEAAGIIGTMFQGQPKQAVSLVNLATIAFRADDLDKADECARRAIELYDALGDTTGHYPAAVNMVAIVALQRGDLDEALAGFELSAQTTKRNMGENRDYASALMNIALVYERMGKPDEAAQMAQRAREVKAKLK